MPRISKPPEERRQELLAAAAHLFSSRGYAHTTVGDIVSSLGVAHGTFYYYFRSKEDVFLAIFADLLQRRFGHIEQEAARRPQGAIQRLNTLIAALLSTRIHDPADPHDTPLNAALLAELHRPENAVLHQKVSTLSIELLSPVFAATIAQGQAEGVFQVQYPKEVAEFTLAGALFWLDPHVFDWSPEEAAARFAALEFIIERLLNAPPGSLSIPTPSPASHP